MNYYWHIFLIVLKNCHMALFTYITFAYQTKKSCTCVHVSQFIDGIKSVTKTMLIKLVPYSNT